MRQARIRASRVGRRRVRGWVRVAAVVPAAGFFPIRGSGRPFPRSGGPARPGALSLPAGPLPGGADRGREPRFSKAAACSGALGSR